MYTGNIMSVSCQIKGKCISMHFADNNNAAMCAGMFFFNTNLRVCCLNEVTFYSYLLFLLDPIALITVADALLNITWKGKELIVRVSVDLYIFTSNAIYFS